MSGHVLLLKQKGAHVHYKKHHHHYSWLFFLPLIGLLALLALAGIGLGVAANTRSAPVALPQLQVQDRQIVVLDHSLVPRVGDADEILITVTNNGQVPIVDIVVTEKLCASSGTFVNNVFCGPAFVDAFIASLAPGRSQVCRATYLLQAGDVTSLSALTSKSAAFGLISGTDPITGNDMSTVFLSALSPVNIVIFEADADDISVGHGACGPFNTTASCNDNCPASFECGVEGSLFFCDNTGRIFLCETEGWYGISERRDGENAFTTTTLAFVAPPSGGTVQIKVESTNWMAVGQMLFVEGAGYLQVVSIVNEQCVVLLNTGFALAGAVEAGAIVTPGGANGPQGASGSQGAQGASGSQGPQGVNGPQGANGSQGPQGAQGPQGVPGDGDNGPHNPLQIPNGTASVVVVGDGPTTVAFSFDSVTYTSLGTSIFNVRANGVRHSAGKWVAVGEGTNSIAYSFNGWSWYGSSSGNAAVGNNPCYAIEWSGSLWVAGCFQGAAYSFDGITWTPMSIPISNTIYDIVYAPALSRWVAVGKGVNNYAYSTTGTSWLAGSGFQLNTNYAVAWDPAVGRFLTVGSGTDNVAYSLNGIAWSTLGNPVFGGTGYGVAAHAGRFVLTGSGASNYFGYSDNGATFTGAGFSPFTTNAKRAVFFPAVNAWLACGNGAYTVAYSTNNGVSWSPVATGLFTATNDIEVDAGASKRAALRAENRLRK